VLLTVADVPLIIFILYLPFGTLSKDITPEAELIDILQGVLYPLTRKI
jgi:hypothetical protein